MAERIPDVPAQIADRERVCRRLHFLGILVRCRPLMHPGSPQAPGDLIRLSSVAAQPDNPVNVARMGRISTEDFAAVLSELERWCHEHGFDSLVRAAASREPVLLPTRLDARG